MFRRQDTIDHPLYAVTVVFNPARYRTRWKLYDDFAKRCEEAGAILYTAEVSYGDRNFVLEAPGGDPSRLLQLNTKDELWIKENVINLLIQRLPIEWKYVAWMDADTQYARDDWADETLHQLQHYDIVQMWSEADDLSDKYEHVQRHHSFVYSWKHDEPGEDVPGYYYNQHCKGGVYTWHPGFNWAARREALNHLGGLIDIGILGSGDSHMAKALIGKAETSMAEGLNVEYKRQVLQWQARATAHIMQNVGYVDGLLLHHWHGAKEDRQYKTRWQILVENDFNPFYDVKRDTQGLWQLSGNKPQLRDDIRDYFDQRNEDAPYRK